VVERPRLDAVVFDAGGTLVRLDFEWMARKVGELGVPLDAATLRRAEIQGRRAYDRSRGHAADPGDPAPLGTRGDTRAYFGGMLVGAGVGSPVLERALEEFLARQVERGLWTRPMEGARETIEELGAMGLRRACVSNSDGRAERHLENCGVRAGLEFVVDSKLVRVEKPDPAIFRIALERLGGIGAPLVHLVGGIVVGLYVPILLNAVCERFGFRYAFTWPKGAGAALRQRWRGVAPNASGEPQGR